MSSSDFVNIIEQQDGSFELFLTTDEQHDLGRRLAVAPDLRTAIERAQEERTEYGLQVDFFKRDPVDLVKEGLETDGGHHKQWYLEQIALALGVDSIWIEEHEGEKGIAP